MTNLAIAVFPNSDLRCMHDGLANIAIKSKLKINCFGLKPGQFVFFINTSKDKMKVFCPNNIICYIKSPRGPLSLETIRRLPETFNGTGFDYDAAVRKELEQRFFKATE